MHLPSLPFQCSIRSIKALLLLSVLALLAACSAPVLKPEQAASLKRIGVVSLLPSELPYEKIGVTVFNNEFASRPVGDSLNVAAREAAERRLVAQGKTVVQLPVDVPALAQRVRSGAIIFDSPAERIGKELSAMAAQHKLDAVLLVAQSFDADTGPRGVRGVRVYLNAGLREIRSADVRAHIMSILVDPQAKALGAQGRGGVGPATRAKGAPWAYVLEENLDEATHRQNLDMMLRLVEGSVSAQMIGMGM